MPARFLQSDKSIVNFIRFPKVSGDIDITVFCMGMISKLGNVKRNECFTKEDSKTNSEFVDSAIRASRAGRVKSAEVNGKRIFAHFNYRFRYTRRDGQEKIFAYPNHGHDSKRYGDEYTQAQQITDGHQGRSPCNSLRSMAIGLVINKQGRVEDLNHISSQGASKKCKEYQLKNLAKDYYIPATFNGTAVSSTHVTYFKDKIGWWGSGSGPERL